MFGRNIHDGEIEEILDFSSPFPTIVVVDG
jgi:hypothetical protein